MCGKANWLPLEFPMWFISMFNGSSKVIICLILPFLSPAPVPALKQVNFTGTQSRNALTNGCCLLPSMYREESKWLSVIPWLESELHGKLSISGMFYTAPVLWSKLLWDGFFSQNVCFYLSPDNFIHIYNISYLNLLLGPWIAHLIPPPTTCPLCTIFIYFQATESN